LILQRNPEKEQIMARRKLPRVHIFTPKNRFGASNLAPSSFISLETPPQKTHFLEPRFSPRLVSQGKKKQVKTTTTTLLLRFSLLFVFFHHFLPSTTISVFHSKEN
jgi:hypothetical protein